MSAAAAALKKQKKAEEAADSTLAAVCVAKLHEYYQQHPEEAVKAWSMLTMNAAAAEAAATSDQTGGIQSVRKELPKSCRTVESLSVCFLCEVMEAWNPTFKETNVKAASGGDGSLRIASLCLLRKWIPNPAVFPGTSKSSSLSMAIGTCNLVLDSKTCTLPTSTSTLQVLTNIVQMPVVRSSHMWDHPNHLSPSQNRSIPST